MNDLWFDVLGILGVAMVVTSYFLLQLQRIDSDGFAYSFWNALGAALIILSLTVDFNLSALVVEGFWLLISVYGLIRWIRTGKSVR